MPRQEKTMLGHAIQALVKTTGLDIDVMEYEPLKVQADAYVKIKVNGKEYEYVVEMKNVDRFAALGQVKHQLEAFILKPLLIAHRLTDDAADKCRELDLNFIDLAGNAYIKEPNFFVLVKGQKTEQNEALQAKGKKAATNPTNLRMVFTLLYKPEMLNAPYREIEKAAGIALGTIGWVFYDLDERGFTIGGAQKGNRVLVEKEKLIREWVTNYPIKLRPKLNPQKFKAPNQDWWKNIDLINYKAKWGGEVAADKLTQHLKPDFFTLYLEGKDIKKNITRLIIDHRLRPDPQGDIEILEAFWDIDDQKFMPDIVPPLLVYADLVATNDPRNLETAKIIYERYIKNADGPT